MLTLLNPKMPPRTIGYFLVGRFTLLPGTVSSD
jgi:hypothetical protein